MRANESSELTASDAVGPIVGPIRSEPTLAARFAPHFAWFLAWGAKGTLAILDQALFAGAQFVLNILLARWLAPAEYGAFAVAYSIFLLVSAVHSALLIEPMLIFGSGRYVEMRRSYLAIVLRGHWLLTIFASVVLLGAGLLVGRLSSQPVGHALCALSVALPFVLLAWLTRRAFYVELQPGRAAAGGALFFCSLVAFACGLRAVNLLTPATAILAMGVAASLAASLHLVWLRSQWFGDREKLAPRDVGLEHWNYGRWVLAAVFPSWTLLNLYYLVLPIWFGLKEAGALKAIMNLVLPPIHALIAFSVLTIPLLVRHRDQGRSRLVRQTVRRLTGIFTVGAVLYFALMVFFRIPIIRILYGGEYSDYSGLPVLLVGLVPVLMAFSVAAGGALRSFERPDLMFWANVAASLVALTFGLWLAADLGIVGAAGGYLAAYAAYAGALWFFYRRLQPARAE
jgi:O-antigen/teichoic acid export membrane protein